MTYSLEFMPQALKEWKKLGVPTREQLKKHLKKRLESPHVQSAKLRGFDGPAYKIKLRSAGVRLVYYVEDGELVVLVLSVGKRERNEAYREAHSRLENR